jgi:hypothetical protein
MTSFLEYQSRMQSSLESGPRLSLPEHQEMPHATGNHDVRDLICGYFGKVACGPRKRTPWNGRRRHTALVESHTAHKT